MFFVMDFYVFSIMLGSLLFVIMISVESKKRSQKKSMYFFLASPYECGFTPFFNKLPSMVLHFYFIALLFLIFDAELILLFPLVLMNSLMKFTSFFSIFFLFMMLLGLLYEWNTKALEWTKF